MRLRAMPELGRPVSVAFLDDRVGGVVTGIDPDRRGVEVRLLDGELMRFRLSRATGTFLAVGEDGTRLLFE